MFGQTPVPSDAPGIVIEQGEGVVQPIDPDQVGYTLVELIAHNQDLIIENLFGVDGGDNFWVFDLSSSPVPDQTVQGSGDGVGIGDWTTRVVVQYDWAQAYADGHINVDQFGDFISSEIEMSLLLGHLSGTIDTGIVYAWSLSIRDDDGQLLYF